MNSAVEKIGNPRLVQRIKFGAEGKLEFDYMWNSEFEWWTIGKARKALIELWTASTGSFILEFSPNILIDEGTKVEFICKPWQEQEVIEQIKLLLYDKLNPIEWTQVEYPTSDHNQNYWCLDQGYFFSLDGNLQNFVEWIRQPSAREQVQIFSPRVAEVVAPKATRESDALVKEEKFTPENEADIRDFLAEVYQPGTTKYTHFTEQKHLHKPTRKAINFSNNLANFGWRTKELNVYVDPKTYQRAKNEVLIWSPEHNGASVYLAPFEISGELPCFDLEQITGVVMLWSSNPDKWEYALERYAIERACQSILWDQAPKNHLIYVAINYIIHPGLISYFEEKTWRALRSFLGKNNIQEIISKYLQKTFPKQKTEAEYEELAKEASDLFQVRMRFFDFILGNLWAEKTFEERIKRLIRVWYKNRDVLEKIKTVDEMSKILTELFPEEPVEAFVKNTNMRVRNILGE